MVAAMTLKAAGIRRCRAEKAVPPKSMASPAVKSPVARFRDVPATVVAIGVISGTLGSLI
jgi:hypothetical protein